MSIATDKMTSTLLSQPSTLPPPLPPPPPNSPGTSISPSNFATQMQSRVPELLIITILTTLCATVFVLGRLYTRLALTRNLGYDDIFLAGSWVLGIVLTVLICVLTKYGVGKHVIFVPMSSAHWIKVLGFSVRIVHLVVLTTTKLSICLFYRRIFQDRLDKILSRSLMAFMAVFTVALFIEGFFACEYGGAFWAPAGCGLASFAEYSAFFIHGSAALSVSADIFLMAFALWRIVPLSIARAQKISLYTIISLGWLAIAASLARAICTGKTSQSSDPTWAAYYIDISASVEVNIGLICASAPALKPLIRKIFPRFLASTVELISGGNNMAPITTNGSSQATRPYDDSTSGVTNTQQSSTTSSRAIIDREKTNRETGITDLENDEEALDYNTHLS